MLAQNSLTSSKVNSERRARSRFRSFKHAKILFNGNNSVYDAVLKNVTAYGAELTVSSTDKLPAAFNLYFVQDEFTVPCQVKWRRPSNIGVSF